MNNLFKYRGGLISRYLAGDCSQEEAKEFEEWINEDTSRREELEYLQKIWHASDLWKTDYKGTEKEIRAGWARLAEKMHSQEQLSNSPKRRNALRLVRKIPNRSHIGQFLRVAALLLFVFGSGVLVSQLFYFEDTHEINENRLTEFSTATSELAGIELLDGSKINLSVESTISLSDNYYQDNRRAYLEGHGYFDVISDSSLPFVVQTTSAEIKALGTAFTVKAYPEEEWIQVVVMNGTVSFTPNNVSNSSETLLNAGDRIRFNTVTGETITNQVNTSNYLEWIEGRIVFEENTLAEATRELERWFNIDFVLEDEALHKRKITAVLDSKSLSNVLAVMGESLDVAYNYDDNKVVIDSK